MVLGLGSFLAECICVYIGLHFYAVECIQSIGAGVGLFFAFSGFQSAGIVAKSDSTLVTIGQLGTPGTILAPIGLVVTLILVIRGVKGGILIGIVLVTIAGIFVRILQQVWRIPFYHLLS